MLADQHLMVQSQIDVRLPLSPRKEALQVAGWDAKSRRGWAYETVPLDSF